MPAVVSCRNTGPWRCWNRPPPALWLDRADYLRDVKSLLAEPAVGRPKRDQLRLA
jgi:hypothetical protein